MKFRVNEEWNSVFVYEEKTGNAALMYMVGDMELNTIEDIKRMQEKRRLLHFANLSKTGITVNNHLLHEVAEEQFGYTTGRGVVKELNGILFKKKAKVDEQNYFKINTYEEGDKFTQIEIKNHQNVDVIDMFCDCIDKSLETNYAELYTSIKENKEFENNTDISESIKEKKSTQDSEVENMFLEKSKSTSGEEGKGTVVGYDVDKDEVVLMYENADKLVECGWINQSEIKLDNNEIKRFLSTVNAKAVLKLGKSPETSVYNMNRNVDYEVYEMTGQRLMTDTSKDKYKLVQIKDNLKEANIDVIKRTLTAVDEVLLTDYAALYERAKERAVAEYGKSDLENRLDNRSPLTPELEAQAWKDNSMYDHAEAIMQMTEEDSEMYQHAKAIEDTITGKDEEEEER